MDLIDQVNTRLNALGYVVKPEDAALIAFSVRKAEDFIRNSCNITAIPEGLETLAVDYACGDFLLAKKTFAPADIAGIDFSPAIKSLSMGDTSTSLSGSSPEQRFDTLVETLMHSRLTELAKYRRLAW